MAVVADTSPVVFLSKLEQLELIPALFEGPTLIPKSVRDEIIGPDIDPVEKATLEAFLSTCEIRRISNPPQLSRALSSADRSAVALAVSENVPLIADDRLLRRFAQAHGVAVIGTVGILLEAMRRGLLQPNTIREFVDVLVERHGYRVRIELYREILATIDRHERGNG